MGDECMREERERWRDTKNMVLLCPYLVIDVALAILERKEKILHCRPQNHKPLTGPLYSHAALGGRMVVLAAVGNQKCSTLTVSYQVPTGSAQFQQLPHRE